MKKKGFFGMMTLIVGLMLVLGFASCGVINLDGHWAASSDDTYDFKGSGYNHSYYSGTGFGNIVERGTFSKTGTSITFNRTHLGDRQGSVQDTRTETESFKKVSDKEIKIGGRIYIKQ